MCINEESPLSEVLEQVLPFPVGDHVRPVGAPVFWEAASCFVDLVVFYCDEQLHELLAQCRTQLDRLAPETRIAFPCGRIANTIDW